MRAPNGSISLQELSHTRRFKYRYRGQYRYLTLPRTPLPVEDQVRKLFELDISLGSHDNTQCRYRDMLVGKPSSSPRGLANQMKTFLDQTGWSLEKNIYYHCYQMMVRWVLRPRSSLSRPSSLE